MKLLNINSSSNRANSVSAKYGQELINTLSNIYPNLEVKERHTTYPGLPFVTDEMLGAFFSKDPLTNEQKEIIRISEELVAELMETDVLVITAPIYNFSVPASLKAYFDLVARAGKTFKYTESGPEGLLVDKKAFVVVSSGGTEINSDMDYAGRYITHFLGFLGISDVELIKLDQLMFKAEQKQDEATSKIKALAIN